MGTSSQASTTHSVPMLDICAGNIPLIDEFLPAIEEICRSGRFVGGPSCAEFEREMADFCRAEFAIGCASGSDALLLALMAIDVQPGDEVIVPSFTFFATASAVWRLGATPVFADIDPKTFNLAPAGLEDQISEYTKAIIPVHLFGQCADMEPILELGDKYDLYVIEDAAQSIGAKYRGRPAGGLGDVGCFSFYPTKNLGGFGDGGMITTSNGDLANRIRRLANHGMSPRYYHIDVGINSRLDSIQAAVLRIKLQHLSDWTTARQTNAANYRRLFEQADLGDLIQLPQQVDACEHVWNQYTIRVRGGLRDAVRQQLTDANIGSEIYYPVPLHRQACFSSLDFEPDSLPETEAASAEVLSLPIFPELGAANQEWVVHTLGQILAVQRGRRKAG